MPDNLDPLLLQNAERHDTLKNIELNGEHQILQQDEISQGIKDLNKTAEDTLLQGSEISSSLEEIAKKNTDFQVIVDGADMAFYKGEKGDKGDTGNTFDELTDSQKEELRGRKGEDGVNGTDGLDGEKGEKGEKGERGERGWRGEKGETGDKGEKGDKGERGEKGDKGDRGEDGKSLSEEKVKEIENIIQFASTIKSSSKTVSLAELDDVNLTGLSQTNGKYNLGSGASGVQSIVAGTNITVDDTDPANPIVNATSGGSTPTGTGFTHITAGVQDAGAKLVDTADINANQVTNAKLAQMATKTYKGRTSALTGDAEDVAVATLKTDLALTKSDVGLSNVDNTSDVNKPVSTAQATADGVVQAFAIQRANHTGTQLASTISDFASTVRATVLTGISFATGTAVTAADSILVAIGKLQAQNTTQDTAIALNTAKVTNATHTGDATGATALTLATVNSNVGSFGLAGSVSQFTVNAKGLITAAANVTISITSSAVTDFATTVRATVLTGLSLASTTVISATDTVLVALGSLQAQITALATATLTFTNKRYTARVYTATNNASLTPEKDTYDIFHLTAMSANTTINNKSTTTYADGDQIRFRFLDNGTPRLLAWGTDYVAKGGIALPSTTIASKNLELGFEYNSNLAKMNLIASAQEA